MEFDKEELTTITKALSHPARLEILNILKKHDTVKVQDLVEMLPLAQSTISQHLKELKDAGFVKYQEEGIQGYTLRKKSMSKSLKLLRRFCKYFED